MVTRELRGWLLDLYEGRQGGLVLWLVGEDGERYRLVQSFPVTFYAAGPAERLRAAWRYLEGRSEALQLARQERRDLFLPRPLPVIAVTVADPALQPRLFRDLQAVFPDLTYYDADLELALRYTARCGAFPLARCRVAVEGDDRVQALEPLDTPWDMDPRPAPLRVLRLAPDYDPARQEPGQVHLSCGRYSYRLALEPVRPLLVNLRAILLRHDPDLLLSTWGDTWLLPRLLELAEESRLDLPLNREPGREPLHRREHSYFSYGQVIYRGRQVRLFGRLHVDSRNAMMWSDYELDGVLELARVTGLPVQTAARVSPGTGISSMQIITALREGILVPWNKQQAERPKTALDLIRADQGGLVYQPLVGLHRDVAEIDFISMYPSVMVRYNISPETRPGRDSGPQGLVPQTLAPLLDRRIALKARLGELPDWHPQRKSDQARAAALKWLLVTCFGYLGYKNARFGRIEAHEAVTRYGREALLEAKETAEALGFTVLHMYVDGLWVRKPGCRDRSDFQPLLERIAERTGLSIALDGVYRWVAFLGSRQDARVPVPNRYFGVFQDGSFKLRGIETRRRDTALFVSQAQMALLELMARAGTDEETQACLRQAVDLLRRRLSALRRGRVPLEALVVRQRLSRELDEYRTPSPAALAAGQLERVGKSLRPGQSVRLIYTCGEPGVYAWELPEPPDPAAVDTARYAELLLRAAAAVLEPFGMTEEGLRQRALGSVAAYQLRLPAKSRYVSGSP